MPKLAVLVLAGTDSHADMGRVSNALETAKEFKEAGDPGGQGGGGQAPGRP